MDKNIAISELLIGLKNKNPETPFRDIFDVVLGAGAYEKLAGEIYDELRGEKK